MEVAGLVASVAQLVKITMKTVEYLNSVKDAPEDRLKVIREATILLSLLWDLQSQVDANRNEE